MGGLNLSGGVDLRAVAGSGILGRISAEDVVRYADGGAEARRPAAGAPAAPSSAPLPDFGKWGETERAYQWQNTWRESGG